METRFHKALPSLQDLVKTVKSISNFLKAAALYRFL